MPRIRIKNPIFYNYSYYGWCISNYSKVQMQHDYIKIGHYRVKEGSMSHYYHLIFMMRAIFPK